MMPVGGAMGAGLLDLRRCRLCAAARDADVRRRLRAPRAAQGGQVQTGEGEGEGDGSRVSCCTSRAPTLSGSTSTSTPPALLLRFRQCWSRCRCGRDMAGDGGSTWFEMRMHKRVIDRVSLLDVVK